MKIFPAVSSWLTAISNKLVTVYPVAGVCRKEKWGRIAPALDDSCGTFKARLLPQDALARQ